MADTAARARELLRDALGQNAGFRDGQLEAILALVDERKRLLVVQRTGWGKSLVYFIATRLLRERGAGPTLIVSPLLSLVADQERMAARLGVRARAITSGNVAEWQQIQAALAAGQIDVLFISPERLANQRFVQKTLPAIQRGIGMLTIDEAHCISDWGHDFRPDYRRIVGVVRQLPSTVPILATTATANDRVIEDIEAQLEDPGRNVSLEVIRGPLSRSSLRLQAIPMPGQAERLAWLATTLPTLPGSGIVYALTVQDAETVSRWLRANGIDAPAYHAGVGQAEGLSSEAQVALRRRLENELRENKVQALVATVALGMGFDKPDLGFVVHFQRPGSVIAYYQQVGRAGRALDTAYAILLDGQEDDRIQDWFIASAFPTIDEQRQILGALEAAESLTVGEIQAQVNVTSQRIANGLKHLEVDGLVAKDGGQWFRTANPWVPNTSRADAVTAQRKAEQRQMREFVSHPGCLMELVATALDDTDARPCGKCANCVGASIVPTAVDPALFARAVDFLRRSEVTIAPRKMGIAGSMFADHLRQANGSTSIPPNRRAQPGRALSTYGDGGWSHLVIEGKYHVGIFDELLVSAAVQLIRDRWRPQPAPEWVTCVPSRRDPTLVRDFAERLALGLGLPFVDAISKPYDTAPQKEMQNSVQQSDNLAGAFRIDRERVLPGPVLLADDIVDSAWTTTILAYELQANGSGPVYPFALAKMKQQAADS